MPNRLRVTRTIVIEGDPGWVRMTLDRSYLKPGTPKEMGLGRIDERPRTEEFIVDEAYVKGDRE